jgi:hypothetical protein
MKTLLRKSVIDAIRTRAIAQIGFYSVIATDAKFLDRWYTVTNRNDTKRSYEVDTFAKTCSCEAFNREGYCKHYAMVQKERADVARYEQEAQLLA